MTNVSVTICGRSRQHCRQQCNSLQNGTVLLQKDARWATNACLKDIFFGLGKKHSPIEKVSEKPSLRATAPGSAMTNRQTAANTPDEKISLSANHFFCPSWKSSFQLHNVERRQTQNNEHAPSYWQKNCNKENIGFCDWIRGIGL